jgi:hypothetical protein
MRKIHPQHQFYPFRRPAAPPAFGVKGRDLFFKGRPQDNRVHRVQKLFPSPGLFPLRVFRVGKCLLCVHAVTVSLYKYLISGAQDDEAEGRGLLVKARRREEAQTRMGGKCAFF